MEARYPEGKESYFGWPYQRTVFNLMSSALYNQAPIYFRSGLADIHCHADLGWETGFQKQAAVHCSCVRQRRLKGSVEVACYYGGWSLMSARLGRNIWYSLASSYNVVQVINNPSRPVYECLIIKLDSPHSPSTVRTLTRECLTYRDAMLTDQ